MIIFKTRFQSLVHCDSHSSRPLSPPPPPLYLPLSPFLYSLSPMPRKQPKSTQLLLAIISRKYFSFLVSSFLSQFTGHQNEYKQVS